MTILFVDDSPEFLKSITDLCKSVRPERNVVGIVDAFEAMKYINHHHRDIRGVITDFKMTNYGMSGNIIVDKCKEKFIPVYVCTGYGNETPGYTFDVPIIEKCNLELLADTLRKI